MHSSDPKLPEVRCRSWRAETLQDQFGGQIQPAQAPVGPEIRVFRQPCTNRDPRQEAPAGTSQPTLAPTETETRRAAVSCGVWYPGVNPPRCAEQDGKATERGYSELAASASLGSITRSAPCGFSSPDISGVTRTLSDTERPRRFTASIVASCPRPPSNTTSRTVGLRRSEGKPLSRLKRCSPTASSSRNPQSSCA